MYQAALLEKQSLSYFVVSSNIICLSSRFFPTTSLPASSHGTYMYDFNHKLPCCFDNSIYYFSANKKHHTGLLDEDEKCKRNS